VLLESAFKHEKHLNKLQLPSLPKTDVNMMTLNNMP